MSEESKLVDKLEQKQSEVKFTEEELEKVGNIQKNYLNLQTSFGQVEMAFLRLKEQKHDLENNLISLQNDEKKFLEEITKKYGEGNLNPETGIFIPNKSQ
tara:strand:+ start:297 stop:596 length:300 start_codon:yes stop_codon:yes gene_type:complete